MDSDGTGNSYQYPLSYTHHQPSGGSAYQQYTSSYSEQSHNVQSSYAHAHGHVQAQRTQQQEQPQQQYQMRQDFQDQRDQRDQEYLEQLFREQRQRHQLVQYQHPQTTQAQQPQPQHALQQQQQQQQQSHYQQGQYRQSDYQHSHYTQSQYQPGQSGQSVQQHHRQSQNTRVQTPTQATSVLQKHPRHLHNPLSTAASASAEANSASDRQSAGDALAALANAQFSNVDHQRWKAKDFSSSNTQQQWPVQHQQEEPPRSQVQTYEAPQTSQRVSAHPRNNTTSELGAQTTHQNTPQASHFSQNTPSYTTTTTTTTTTTADPVSSRSSSSSVPQGSHSQSFQTAKASQGHVYPAATTATSSNKRPQAKSPTYANEQTASIPNLGGQSPSNIGRAFNQLATTSEVSTSQVPTSRSSALHTAQSQAYQSALPSREQGYAYPTASAASQSRQYASPAVHQHKKTSSTSSTASVKAASNSNPVPQVRSVSTSASKSINPSKPAASIPAPDEPEQGASLNTRYIDTTTPAQYQRDSLQTISQAQTTIPQSQETKMYYNYSQASNSDVQHGYNVNTGGTNSWQMTQSENTPSKNAEPEVTATIADSTQQTMSGTPQSMPKQKATPKPRAKAAPKPRVPKEPKQKAPKKAQEAAAQLDQYQVVQTTDSQQPLGTQYYQAYSAEQAKRQVALEVQENIGVQTQVQPQQYQQSVATNLSKSPELQQHPKPQAPVQRQRKPRAKTAKPPKQQKAQHLSDAQADVQAQQGSTSTPYQSQPIYPPEVQQQHFTPSSQQFQQHEDTREQSQLNSTAAQVSAQQHPPPVQFQHYSTPAQQTQPRPTAAEVQPQPYSKVQAQQKTRQQSETKAHESARTSASVSNLISPEQQAFPTTAAEGDPSNMKSKELAKMEHDMREMVERMREYQSRDPAAFQAIWEHVKRSEHGNRSQRSPSLPVAKPHERIQSPRTQPPSVATSQVPRSVSQVPAPPAQNASHVQPVASGYQAPAAKGHAEQSSVHLQSRVEGQSHSPISGNASIYGPNSHPGSQRNAICQSIINFLSHSQGGPKPVPYNIVMQLLEKPVMPSFHEFCITFENYGYKFNRKALAEELLKAFPETGDTAQTVNNAGAARSGDNHQGESAPIVATPNEPIPCGSQSTAILIQDDGTKGQQTTHSSQPSPSVQSSTVFEPASDAPKPHRQTNGPQTLTPSMFQQLDPSGRRTNPSHLLDLPRNPTPQLIRSLKIVAFDGTKSSVLPESFEPEKNYITPSLIYNSIPPLSSSLSRSFSRQSPLAGKENEPDASKVSSQPADATAPEIATPVTTETAASIQPEKPNENVAEKALELPDVEMQEPLAAEEEQEPPRIETPKSLIIVLKLPSNNSKVLLRVLKFRSEYEAAQQSAARHNSTTNQNASPATQGVVETSKAASELPSPSNDKAVGGVVLLSHTETADISMPDATGTPSGVKPKEAKPLGPALPPIPSFHKKQARKTNLYDPSNIAEAVLIATGRHPAEKGLNSRFLPWMDMNPPLANYHSDLGQIRWEIYDPAPALGSTDLDPDGDDPMEIDGEDYDLPGDESPMNVTGAGSGLGIATLARTRGRPRGANTGLSSSPHVAPSTPEHTSTFERGRRGRRGRQRGVKIVNGKVVTPHKVAGAGSDAQTPEQTRSGPTPSGSGRGRPRGRGRGRRVNITPSDRPTNAGLTSDIGFRKRRFSGGSSDTPRSGSQIRRLRTPLHSYECKWAKCGAELHNYDTLKQHVVRKHKNVTTRGKFPCLWKGCYQDGEDSTPRKELNNGLEWDAHILGEHLEAIRIALGNGPEGGLFSSPISRVDESVRRMSVDRDGRQITPIASPAPRGYQFTPPPGFRPNEEFRAAHAEDDGSHMLTRNTMERVTMIGAGMESSGEQTEFFAGGLDLDSRRLVRRDRDSEWYSFGRPFLASQRNSGAGNGSNDNDVINKET